MKKLKIEFKEIIREKGHKEAFDFLFQNSNPELDYPEQYKLYKLFNSISCESLRLKKIKIAILPSCTVDHFVDIFKFCLAGEGFDAEFFVAEFDTIDQTILDPNSGLYSFEPDVVWIFTNYRDVKIPADAGASAEEVDLLVEESVDGRIELWKTILNRTDAVVLQNNADQPLERVFGNFESNVPWGNVSVLRSYNMTLARKTISGVTIFDLDYISGVFGKVRWEDSRYWYHSKHAFSMDAIGLLAFHASRLIASIKGLAKKCLVLDLDNTLWGGVIGDDGLNGIKLGNGAIGEAFVDFQKYVKKLKDRGVILAVCSKNEEANAKLPFEKHPDMQLKLDDIAIFVANWDNKAENIKKIADSLNIGLNSIVFVDDNPVERNLVREFLPEVSIPELPEDPVDYKSCLGRHSYFETISFSNEDESRNDMYRKNYERKKFQQTFTDISGYLKSLEMEAIVQPFDDFHLPRITQLINKSNQFNLTTIRYSENDVLKIMKDNNFATFYFKLKDRFGDNGLISLLILNKKSSEELYIDTWVMSCRVLSRGMEEFIQNELIAFGKQEGFSRISAKYIATSKNELVKNLYHKLGFTMEKEMKDPFVSDWVYSLENGENECKVFIKRMNNT
ncbi:MAG: hypothetical protein COA79_17165 [Planctomycetota bacterium]|nr:MAG: hypothetical protein COA79_17165 [Planctomycetota bacterium]